MKTIAHEPHVQARECAESAKKAMDAAKGCSDLRTLEFHFEDARRAMVSCGLVKTQNAASEARRLSGDYSMAAHELECVTRYVEQCAHYMHEIAARMALLSS